MVSRKYTADYRLENSVDPKTGKIVTKPVYKGEWHSFSADDQTVRTMRRVFPALTAAAVLAFVIALLLNTPVTRHIYVLLPFAACVFPLFYLCAGCLRLVRAEPLMTREHSDKTGARLSSSSLFLLILMAASAIGQIVVFCREGIDGCDIVFFVCTLIVLAAAAAMFCLRRHVRSAPVDVKKK